MTVEKIAQQAAAAGKVLMAASLFLWLIWWPFSVYLFVAGGLVYAVASVLNGAYGAAPFTAPE